MGIDEIKDLAKPEARTPILVFVAIITGIGVVLAGLNAVDKHIAAGARAELAPDLAAAAAARAAIDRRVGDVELATHAATEKLDHLAESLGDVKSDVRVIRATVVKDHR